MSARKVVVELTRRDFATRAEVAEWARSYGEIRDDDLMHDLWAARGSGDEPMPVGETL